MTGQPSLQTPPANSADWREWVIVTLVGFHLLFLPWSLGGMPLWSQKISLALAGLAFITGLLLRITDPRLPFTVFTRRLLLHPPLWLGGALLLYVAIQAHNPAWKYTAIGNQFFMLPVAHIEWLPSGAETPLRQMSPFRHLLINSAAVLAILTAGLFVHRRRSVRILFGLLAINGLALATVGFAQVFLEAQEILWTYKPAHDVFYASFVYRNHAAAYLNIVFAVSAGLYFFYRERAWSFRRRAIDTSPVFFFTALAIFTLALFSQSRAGTVIAVTLLLLTGLFSFIHGVRWRRLRETTLVSSVYFALFAIFVATFISILGLDRITERFSRLQEVGAERSMQTRLIGYKATWEMYQDKWLWGWGAGSFEYLFPAYQEQYPEIHKGPRGRMIWEYTHNDPLQYLTEYGAVGMSLILALGAYWAWRFLRRRAWRHPLLLFAVIAGLAVVAHSFIDFPLQNPAILVTVGLCFALATRYLDINEETRGDRAPAEASASGHQSLKGR